jgi:IS30 family transposase
MGMQGRPITCIEREQIEFRLRSKLPIRQIARDLKRAHRIIQYEIKIHSYSNGKYSAIRAQNMADEMRRKLRNRKCKLDADEDLRNHVISQLKAGRSPDVIAGRLKTYPPPRLKGKTISHETIYTWIYTGNGRKLGLHHYLCSGRPRRHRHYTRKSRKNHILNRVSIHERPEYIEQKQEIGHWESDSMAFSKQKERLSVQYERKAKYVMIHRLSNGTAEATDEALNDSIQLLPQYVWKTITFDNGGEGANHSSLQLHYGIKTYFCDNYASWQKGGVENVNGIIRRYLPRKTNMSDLTQSDIYAIQEQINNTPRKTLGYKTPKEVMAEECGYRVAH